MESDEQPRSVCAGPLPQDSPPQKEGTRARRRSIRGRRSEIRVEMVGASPMVIPAPLSDSLAENSVSDLEAELTQRRNHTVAYIAQLRTEKEQWEERLERHSMMAKRAARIVDRSHERKPAARIPIEELGQVNTTQKPQYVLHRVMRKFNNQNTDLQLQKTVDELTAEQDAVAESISAQVRTPLPYFLLVLKDLCTIKQIALYMLLRCETYFGAVM